MAFSIIKTIVKVILISRVVAKTGKNNTLYLGQSGAWTGPFSPERDIACGFIYGLETIREMQLLPGYEFEYQARDSNCNNRQGMKVAIDLWNSMDDLDVIFGDSCSIVCQPFGLLSAAWNIPTISNFCASDALSNTETYPTFSRVIGAYVTYVPPIAKVALTLNFTRVAIITGTVDVHKFMADNGKVLFEAQGQTVIYKIFETTVRVNDGVEVLLPDKIEKMRKLVRELKNEARFYLLLMYTTDIRHFLIICHEEGMLNGDYAFHGTDMYPSHSPNPAWRPDLTDTFLFQGYMAIDVAVNIKNFKDFQKRCYSYAHLPVFDAFEKPPGPDSVSLHAAMKHDSVLMWGIAVNKTIEQGYAPDDGLQITKNIYNITFEGLTGTVMINEKGDRNSDFLIAIMQNGKPVAFLEWRVIEQRMLKRYKPGSPNDWSGILWSGNATEVPKNAPPCGWDGEFCVEGEKTQMATIAGASSAIGVVLVVAIIAAAIMRRSMYESKLKEAASYILPWNAVVIVPNETESGTKSRATLQSGVSNKSIAVYHTETVHVMSDTAAVKRLGPRAVNFADRNVLRELKYMKDTKHDNINAFLGVCLDLPNACIFMQYAQRGSLDDVLTLDEVKLTWDFKLSIANDIANGMKFLHSSEIGHHGHLTSRNCVIDGRWACKVTDHGLNYVRSVSGLTDKKESSADFDLWTAPEILKDRKKYPTGLKEGDVFSFAIIVQELILEGSPYCGNYPNLEPEEIIAKVAASETPPFRPTLQTGDADPRWINLMKYCWHENTSDRLTFVKILPALKELNGGAELSLVDNMINRLENHTQNLEGMVNERTQELHEEKQKVEQLLQELLPQSVADSLKAGVQIQPESFESVTIFFSDVVSFTRISAAGTPLDVVKLLNLMYTMFDDVSAQFDAYKVATIGDAYFVASGVPIRNGNKHVAEISKMALKLLESVGNFPIPHLPMETLKLRIGVHSGSCVAGVAGIKMPRYLLFGDTIDIASRMEAQGESMRIHISQITVDHLRKAGGFVIEERGELEVKGLGLTTTYWLNGYLM